MCLQISKAVFTSTLSSP